MSPEHEHIQGQSDPRCLKWGEGRALFSHQVGRIRRVHSTVKRVGEVSELSTIEWGSTHLRPHTLRLGLPEPGVSLVYGSPSWPAQNSRT